VLEYLSQWRFSHTDRGREKGGFTITSRNTKTRGGKDRDDNSSGILQEERGKIRCPPELQGGGKESPMRKKKEKT